LSQTLSHMIEALKLEVDALKRKGRAAPLKLGKGKRIEQAGGRWIYGFSLEPDRKYNFDLPAIIRVKGEELGCEVVSFQKGALRLAIPKDLGLEISQAYLFFDDTELIKKLIERLYQVRSQTTSFNHDAAERIIGNRPLTSIQTPTPAEPPKDGLQLNPEQQQAVEHSLGNSVTYLWGPPGTGKTLTLARMAEAHYRAGRSVLLVSNTNIAVDTALEMLAQRLEDDEGFQNGAVLREGLVAKPELRSRFGDCVILDEVVKRLGQPLWVEKEKLRARLKELQQDQKQTALLIQTHGRLKTLETRLQSLEGGQLKAENKARQHKEIEHQQNGQAETLWRETQRGHGMNCILRFLRRINLEDLRRERTKALHAARNAAEEARRQNQAAQKAKAELERMEPEHLELIKKLESAPSHHQCRKHAKAIQSEIDDKQERVNEISRKLDALGKQIEDACRVKATTVYRSYLGGQELKPFDVVMIDEASMVMLPMAYFAAGLSRQAVVAAGDFRQIPPIVQSKDAKAETWLIRDVFMAAGIPGQTGQQAKVPALVSLQTQYRMREPICEVVSRFFLSRPSIEYLPFG
jgi:hypothetical protein